MTLEDALTSRGVVAHASPEELKRLLKGKIIRRTVLKCERAKPTKASSRQKRSKNVSKKDVACPHRVELLVFEERPEEVYAIETAPHCNHGTDGPRYEPLTDNLKQYIEEQALLNIGPKSIIANILKLASESKYKRFSLHETRLLTTHKVEICIRRIRNSRTVHTDDRVALDLMAKDPKNNIIHYNRNADELVLVLCSDFQAAMLEKFGDAVFLDTVHGQTNKGLYQLTMLVVSETGKGVPVAYCLSNVEKAEHWSLLIDKSFGRTNRDPSKSIYMSDDCVRIKKCVQDLKARHLLCWFHMMQTIERRLRSYQASRKRKRGADVSDDASNSIKYKIRDLQRIEDEGMYRKKLEEFYNWLLTDKVVHEAMGVRPYATLPLGKQITAKEEFRMYFEAYWNGVGCEKAAMWARFGRVDEKGEPVCWHAHDTNNMIESYFCQQKHFLSKSVRTQRVSSHIHFLNNTVIPWYIHDRQQMLDGIIMSRQQKMTHTIDWTVNWLCQSKERLSIIKSDIGLGNALDPCDAGVTYIFCLADMSCTCPGPHAMPCVHLEAASVSVPITLSMLTNAAKLIKHMQLISRACKVVDGLYKCKKISSHFHAQGKRAWLKLDEGDDHCFCECFLFKKVGMCSHLLALDQPFCGMSEGENLLGPGEVKAFRPATLMDTESDPSTRFQNELEPYITQKEHVLSSPFYEEYIKEVRKILAGSDPLADSAFIKAGFDDLIGYLKKRFAPDLPSGWTSNDVRHQRQATDRKHKYLFK